MGYNQLNQFVFFWVELIDIILYNSISICCEMQSFLLLALLCGLSVTSLFQLFNIGNSGDPILAISTGFVHVTLAFGYAANNGTVQRIDLFNSSSLSLITLNNNPGGLTLNSMEEFKLTNNEVTNRYIVGQSGGGVIRDNFGTWLYSWAANPGLVVGSCFGATSDFVYQHVELTGSCYLRVVDIVAQLYADFDSEAGKCGDLAYYNGMIYSLTVNPNIIIKIKIFTQSARSLVHSQSEPDSLYTPPYKIEAFHPFYSLGIQNKVSLFSATNYSNICNISLSAPIHDLKMDNRWLYTSYAVKVDQYFVQTCMFFGTFTTPGPGAALIQLNFASALLPRPQINLLTQMYNSMQIVEVTDMYPCGACGSCLPNYSPDGSGNCYYSGPPIAPVPIPTPPPPASLLIPSLAPILQSCFQTGPYSCQLFCDYKCNSCSNSSTSCQSCSPKRELNNDSQCVLPFRIALAMTTLSVVNTFRPNTIQFAFLTFDRIDLYQYHQLDYAGIFRDVLDEINVIQNFKWSLISIDSLLDWTQRPYFPNSSYNAYTNYRFLQVQRQNALLFETIKAYYSVYIPIVFVSFFLLKRIFILTCRFRASQLLRPYSFWMQFFVIVFVSDSTQLNFLSLSYFQMLFSSDFWLRLAHCATVTGIGIFLIVTLSMFFLSSYFYGQLCKYFLFNLYRVNFSMAYAFFRYSLKPLTEAAIHVFLFSYPYWQSIALIALETISATISIALENQYQIFRCKFIFLTDTLLSLLLLMVLAANYLKYFIFTTHNAILQICETSLLVFFYIAFFILIISALHPIISTFSSLFFNKNEKKRQDKCFCPTKKPFDMKIISNVSSDEISTRRPEYHQKRVRKLKKKGFQTKLNNKIIQEYIDFMKDSKKTEATQTKTILIQGIRAIV